jgi:hypothetical protein
MTSPAKIFRRVTRCSGRHCTHNELPCRGGAQHKADRIEVIRFLSVGPFQEEELLRVVDLNPELAQNVTSQRSNDGTDRGGS